MPGEPQLTDDDVDEILGGVRGGGARVTDLYTRGAVPYGTQPEDYDPRSGNAAIQDARINLNRVINDPRTSNEDRHTAVDMLNQIEAEVNAQTAIDNTPGWAKVGLGIANAIGVVPAAISSVSKEYYDLIGTTNDDANNGPSLKDFFDQLGFGSDDIPRYGPGDLARDTPHPAFDSTPEAGPGFGTDFLGQLANSAQNIAGDPYAYLGGAAAEVVLDPLTYLSGGGAKAADIASIAGRGAIKGATRDIIETAGRRALTEFGDDAVLKSLGALDGAADDVARSAAERQLTAALRGLDPKIRYSPTYRTELGIFRPAGRVERAPTGQALVDLVAERGQGVIDDAVLKSDLSNARRYGIAGLSDPAKYGLTRGYTYRLPATRGVAIDLPNPKTGPIRFLTRRMDDGGLIGDGLLWFGTKFKGSTSRLNAAAREGEDSFYRTVLSEQGRRLVNSVATKHETNYVARLAELVSDAPLKAALFRGDVKDPAIREAWNEFASIFEEATAIEARRRSMDVDEFMRSSDAVPIIREHIAANSPKVMVSVDGPLGVVDELVDAAPYSIAYAYQVSELLARNPEAPWRLAEIEQAGKTFANLRKGDRRSALFTPATLAHMEHGSNIIGQAEALKLWEQWFPGQVFRSEPELTARFLDELRTIGDSPPAVELRDLGKRPSAKAVASKLYDPTPEEAELRAIAGRIGTLDEQLRAPVDKATSRRLLDERKLLIEQEEKLRSKAKKIIAATPEEADAILTGLDPKDLDAFADELGKRATLIEGIRSEFGKRLATARDVASAMSRDAGIFDVDTLDDLSAYIVDEPYVQPSPEVMAQDPVFLDTPLLSRQDALDLIEGRPKFVPDKAATNPGRTGAQRHVPRKLTGPSKLTGEAEKRFSEFRVRGDYRRQLESLGIRVRGISSKTLLRHKNPDALLRKLYDYADEAVDSVFRAADAEIGSVSSISDLTPAVRAGIPEDFSLEKIVNIGPVQRMRWTTKALVADTAHAHEAAIAIDYMLTKLDEASVRLTAMSFSSDPAVLTWLTENPEASLGRFINDLSAGDGTLRGLRREHRDFIRKAIELDPNFAQANLFSQQRAMLDSIAHQRVQESLTHLAGLEGAASTLSGTGDDVVSRVENVVTKIQKASSYGPDVSPRVVEREAAEAWTGVLAVLKELKKKTGAYSDLDLWLNKTADRLGDSLYEFGGGFLPSGSGATEAAQQLMGTFRKPGEMGALYDFMHSASSVWRATATMTPGFNLHNYLGGLVQMFGAGVSPKSISIWHRYSPIAVAATVDEVENLLPVGTSKLWERIGDDTIRSSMQEVWSHGVADVSLMRSIGGSIEGQVDMALPLSQRMKQAYRLAKDNGRTVGAYADASATLFHGVGQKFDQFWARSFDSMWRMGRRTSVDTGELAGWELIAPSIEGHLRGSTMLDRLLNGHSVDEALNQTLRLHIDYSDLTVTDRWMNEMFPFWTWRSRSMAYQTSYAMRHPVWYARRYQFYQETQERNNLPFTPDWAEMGARISTPFNVPGIGQIGITSPDPFNESISKINALTNSDMSTKKALVSLTLAEGSPIWRAALEYMSGTTIEGVPIEKRGDPKVRLPGPKQLNQVVGFLTGAEEREDGWYYASAPLVHVLTENLPLLAQMDRLSNDRGGKDSRPDRSLLAAWLGWLGFRTANVNERSQWGEKQRLAAETKDLIREMKRQGYTDKGG